jgi:hypothetical protein
MPPRARSLAPSCPSSARSSSAVATPPFSIALASEPTVRRRYRSAASAMKDPAGSGHPREVPLRPGPPRPSPTTLATRPPSRLNAAAKRLARSSNRAAKLRRSGARGRLALQRGRLRALSGSSGLGPAGPAEVLGSDAPSTQPSDDSLPDGSAGKSRSSCHSNTARRLERAAMARWYGSCFWGRPGSVNYTAAFAWGVRLRFNSERSRVLARELWRHHGRTGQRERERSDGVEADPGSIPGTRAQRGRARHHRRWPER